MVVCLVALFCLISPQIKIDSFLSADPPHLEGRKHKVYDTAPGSRASEVKCPLVSVYFQHWLGTSLPGSRGAHIKLSKGQATAFSITLLLRHSRPWTEEAKGHLEAGPYTGVRLY